MDEVTGGVDEVTGGAEELSEHSNFWELLPNNPQTLIWLALALRISPYGVEQLG